MTNSLLILGVTFSVDENSGKLKIQSPTIKSDEVWKHNSRVSNSNLILNGSLFFGTQGELRCKDIRIPIAKITTDEFALIDGQIEQEPNAFIRVGKKDSLSDNSKIRIDVGPFSALKEPGKFRLYIESGKLILKAPLPPPPGGDRTLPFKFVRGNDGFDIDLTKSKVTLGRETIVLKTFSLIQVDKYSIFNREHILEHPTDLYFDQKSALLKFVPKDKNLLLPLHISCIDNIVRADITARNYKIGMELQRDGAVRAVKVNSIALEGELAFSSLSEPSGKPAIFEIPANGINCVIRTSAHTTDLDTPLSLPSSFLLSPEKNDSIKSLKLTRPDHKSSRLHGPVYDAAYENVRSGQFHCNIFQNDGLKNIPGIADDLLYVNTLPWLELEGSDADKISFVVARPGESYGSVMQNGAAVKLWNFSNAHGAAPLLMPETLTSGLIDKTKLDLHENELNQASSKMKMPPEPARHESQMLEVPTDGKEIELKKAFSFSTSSDNISIFANVTTFSSPVRLGQREVTYDFGVVSVKFEVIEGETPEILVIWYDSENSKVTYTDAKGFPLEDNINRFTRGGSAKGADSKDNKTKRRPVALVKLTREKPLNILLNELRAPDGFTFDRIVKRQDDKLQENDLDFVNDVIAPKMRTKEWMGLILFEVPVNYESFEILKSLLGTPKGNNWDESPLKLVYLAISPKPPGQDGFSKSGAIYWSNDPASNSPVDYDGKQEEIKFRMETIEMAFDDGRLAVFRSYSKVLFVSSFGQKINFTGNDSEISEKIRKHTVKLLGSLNERTGEVCFLGQFDEPVDLFDNEGLGPIKDAKIKSARIVEANGEVSIDLDGTITLKDISFDGRKDKKDEKQEEKWITGGNGRLLDFRRLGIHLPKLTTPDLNWRNLSFNYPSLNIDLSADHFKLLELDSVDLRIQSIGLDWDGSFDWNRLITFPNTANVKKCFLMGLRLDLSGLPDLALGDLKRLQFDLQLGIEIDGTGNWSDKLRVAISGVGFEPFRLGLMRFLEVSADKVSLKVEQIPWNNEIKSTPWLEIVNANVVIVGYKVIENLTIYIFTLPDGRRGFLGFIEAKKDNNIFNINWALIAQNAVLPKQFAIELLSLPQKTGENKDLLGKITSIAKSKQFVPDPARTNDMAVGEWIFAAGISVLGDFLKGKFLFQDKRYYGIALEGDWLKNALGYDLAIAVLYIKRDRPEDDGFYVAIRIPAATIGSIRFTGGEVAFEIEMDGDFLVDAGFPWLRSTGGRAWDRTLGAIVTPFQGSGGFYISKRSRQEVRTLGSKYLVLSGGYAVQAGLGATFGGGIFVVWARAGITVVLEGAAAISFGNSGDIVGLKLSGGIGILVEGGGQLRFWIISADILISASAEARGTLIWGDWDAINDGRPVNNTGRTAQLQLDFELFAHASANACIGSGWFKVCKSIDVSLSMPFRQTLLLG